MKLGLLRWSAVLLSISVALTSGCKSQLSDDLRAHTYPPNFNYIPADKLESTMWRLAEQVDGLDERLRSATAGDEALQADVARMLAEMEETSRALGQGDWPSNHPRVSRNIEAFRRDLRDARRSVDASPPNFFLAGSISGACMNCHGSR